MKLGLISILIGIIILFSGFEISKHWEKINNIQDHKIQQLESNIKQHQIEIESLKRKVKAKQKIIDEISRMTIRATAYNAVPRQTDNDPEITSCMSKPTVGSIAVSQDLYYKGWTCGKRVHLDQLGIFTIKDVFPKYYKGKLVTNQIDVLTETEEQAFEFGVKHNVKVVLLSHYDQM